MIKRKIPKRRKKKMKTAVIDASLHSSRLDSACSELFGITRSGAVKLIDEGCITVNGEKKDKKYALKIGDTVVLNEPEARADTVQPEDIPIDIVYEDDHIAVVNKPKGMVVHPAPGNYSGTLVSALLYKMQGRLSSINGVVRPGIVHRIDKDTSGLLMIAKTDEAHLALAEQIKDHSFERRYRAIAVGAFKERQGTVDKPIGRHPKDRKKMAVTQKNSKNAVTHYEVLCEYGGFSYVEYRLETGRTHQIRVHSSSIGHPLAGDTVYGGGRTRIEISNEDLLRGQCLHAMTLGFVHPKTHEFMSFTSELPEYFTAFMKKIGMTDTEL